LLAVAAYLRQRGADVRLIAEQAPRWNLARFASSLLWHQSGKLMEALGLGWALRGVPLRSHCWPIRAHGNDRLLFITLTDGARTWTAPCDALACGFGLVPSLELPMVLGCAIESGFVKVNHEQQTSMPNVYAIGEITGIGGLDKALIEGQIAGSVAAGRSANQLLRERTKALGFVAQLAETFALREELRRLADKETIVCRCEDVTFGQLQRHASWRDAKLQTRCGMGPCQGRICGPAVEFLFGWTGDSIRPPIFPTALGNLVAANS
jgi:NADPH-dependent 2,4-dienoyl-CoA reductase/sulfur reductase-like enzyme